MFSRKEWNSPPFCEDDVRREAISTTLLRARSPRVVSEGCMATSDLGGSGARVRGRRLEVSVPAGATGEVVRGGRRVALVRGPARRLVSAARSGTYLVRFRTGSEVRRVAFVRRGSRLRSLPAFERRDPCGLIRAASLLSPVVGRRSVVLNVALTEPAALSVRVSRAGKTVTRYRSTRRGARYRVPIRSSRLRRRGTYRLTITATSARQRATVTLNAVRR
jgi:hypothetical protein